MPLNINFFRAFYRILEFFISYKIENYSSKKSKNIMEKKDRDESPVDPC